MTQTEQRFVVADPRTFEGDPFEVAERSFAQSEAIAGILKKSIADARVMARNAEMTRQLDKTGETDAADFEDMVLAKQIDAMRAAVEKVEKSLKLLGKAASFDPKKPIGRV